MQFAPRVHGFLVIQIWRLDDGCMSYAELCRRVGRVASTHDITRPSYETIRRIARQERLRRLRRAEALRRALADTIGAPPDPLVIIDRFLRVARLSMAYEPSGPDAAPP